MSPEISDFLAEHDPKTDQFYLDSPEVLDKNSEIMKSDIEAGFEHVHDLVYVAASPGRGYGLFARKELPANTCLGIYTGRVELQTEDVEYAWSYKSKHRDGKSMVVNGRHQGNYLRFVNDFADRQNCDSYDVIYEGRWYILYYTNRIVAKNEELSVSYGSAYWESSSIGRL